MLARFRLHPLLRQPDACVIFSDLALEHIFFGACRHEVVDLGPHIVMTADASTSADSPDFT